MPEYSDETSNGYGSFSAAEGDDWVSISERPLTPMDRHADNLFLSGAAEDATYGTQFPPYEEEEEVVPLETAVAPPPEKPSPAPIVEAETPPEPARESAEPAPEPNPPEEPLKPTWGEALRAKIAADNKTLVMSPAKGSSGDSGEMVKVAAADDVREGKIIPAGTEVNESNQEAPEDTPPTLGRLKEWAESVTPNRDGAVDGTTMAMAVIVSETPSTNATIRAEAARNPEAPAIEASPRDLIDQAADNPSSVRDMIMRVKPPEGSAWAAFLKADPEGFRNSLPNPTADELFEGMRLTRSGSESLPIRPEATDLEGNPITHTGQGELGVYQQLTKEEKVGRRDSRSYTPRSMGRSLVGGMVAPGSPTSDREMRKLEDVDIKKARTLYYHYMNMQQPDKAVEVAKQLMEKQNGRLESQYTRAQLARGETPGHMPPTQGTEERLRQLMGFTFHMFEGNGGTTADEDLVNNLEVLTALRAQRRDFEAYRDDPEGWRAGDRPQMWSPEGIEDQALLAAARLHLTMLMQQPGSAIEIVRELVQAHAGGKMAAEYAKDPAKLLEGEMPPEAVPAAFEAGLQTAHATYKVMLQTDRTAAERFLNEETRKLAEFARGQRQYQAAKENHAEAPSAALFSDEYLNTLSVEDIERLRRGTEENLNRESAASGVADPVTLDWLRRLQERENALKGADSSRLQKMQERRVKAMGREASAQLFPTNRTLIVDGPLPKGVTPPGPLATYVATHGEPDDTVDIFDPVRYGEWATAVDTVPIVERITHMPYSTDRTYKAIYFEGKAPEAVTNPQQVLGLLEPGGVCVIRADYNERLTNQLLQAAGDEMSALHDQFNVCIMGYGDRTPPSPNLVFTAGVRGDRHINVQYPAGAWTALIFRKEANGDESSLLQELMRRTYMDR